MASNFISPLRTLPARSPLAASVAFTAVVAGFAVPLGLAHGDAYSRIDSEWYLLIANGHTAQAMQPFTARQLGPLLAHWLSVATHATLLHGFLAVGVLSLLATAMIVSYLLCRSGAGWPSLGAVAVLYFWTATFGSFMLPDTLSAALLACFLLLLWHRQYTLAAAMLLPMFLARESTILVLLCLLAVLGTSRQPTKKVLQISAVALAASIGGLAIVKHLAAHALANREQLNPLLYMAGKVPWNFAANVLSMRPWTPALTAFCQVPRYSFRLPLGLHVGGAQTAGLCGWDPAWQVQSLVLALCSFGLLPVVTFYLLRHHRQAVWPERTQADLFTRFCVAYGLLSYGMAPLLGHTVERLFFYAWPVFLLATPTAALRAFSVTPQNRSLWAALAAIHVATAWFDSLLFASWDQTSWQRAWCATAWVVAANLAAWVLLRKADKAASA